MRDSVYCSDIRDWCLGDSINCYVSSIWNSSDEGVSTESIIEIIIDI